MKNEPGPESLVEALRRDNALLERVSRADGLERLLEIVGEDISESGQVDGYLINLVDEAGDYLLTERVVLPPELKSVEQTYLSFKFSLDERDANAVCFRERRALRIEAANVGQFPGSTEIRFRRWRMRSLLTTPFFHDGDCIGTLMQFSRSMDLDLSVAERARSRLERFAPQIRMAQSNARIQRKQRSVENAAQDQQDFLRFVTTANNIHSVDSICDEFSRELLRRLPFELAGVLMLEADRLRLRKLALGDERFRVVFEELERYYRAHPFVLNQEEGAVPLAFVQNVPLHFPDARDLKALPMSPKDQDALAIMRTPRTLFMNPIRLRGRAVGILLLASLDRPVPLLEQQKEFIELLCGFIGTAMGNAELYEIIGKQNAQIEALNVNLRGKLAELGQLATTDRLTGLHNFGYFEAELSRRVDEYSRKVGSPHTLGLVIFDVDHFKRFNDSYGHLAGNEVLQRVAERLRKLARSMDVPCRYGGEEFVVLLPRCDVEGAAGFAERVRADIFAMPIYPGDPDLRVSVSAGCAVYEPGESPSQFLERADQALYRAKDQGRNRVEQAAATVSETCGEPPAT